MSYPSYAYLRGLLEMAESKLKQNYQVALTFIPSEPYDPKRPSGSDKAHKVLMSELANIRQVREELLAAVQAAYRGHPNPGMREFWGVEN